MQSKILKSPEEFEQLKEMLIQDGELNGLEVFFEDKEPESYPCLVKIDEINNSSLSLDMEGSELDPEEMLDNAEWTEGFIYEFVFITKQEIEELLGA